MTELTVLLQPGLWKWASALLRLCPLLICNEDNRRDDLISASTRADGGGDIPCLPVSCPESGASAALAIPTVHIMAAETDIGPAQTEP